jgi:hypothetical protein
MRLGTVCEGSMRSPTPIAWRVWSTDPPIKLSSSILPPPQFRDFQTEKEAHAFKQSLRERIPNSVVCVVPLYVIAKRPTRLNNRLRL